MDEFDVAPIDSFNSTQALERMLRLLIDLFDEVLHQRRNLVLSDQNDAMTYHLDESLVAAIRVARDDARELIRKLQAVDFSLQRKDSLRLDGPVLRFKMMAIKAALQEANAVHPIRGRAVRRGWPLYRRALISLMAAIEGPLANLTETLEGPYGAIEFKRGLSALIVLNSTPAA